MVIAVEFNGVCRALRVRRLKVLLRGRYVVHISDSSVRNEVTAQSDMR